MNIAYFINLRNKFSECHFWSSQYEWCEAACAHYSKTMRCIYRLILIEIHSAHYSDSTVRMSQSSCMTGDHFDCKQQIKWQQQKKKQRN